MTLKEIKEKLEEGESLKMVTQAYSEIANLKVKKIRANVERNRLFFQEISKVYAIIRKFAVSKKINMVKPKKTVSLVLTSNQGFYGSINSDLLKFFVNSTKNMETDRIVVNKTGIEFFKTQPIFKNYTEVLLKDDQPSAAELISLVNLIKDYNQVLIFFSSMASLLTQVPTVTDITPGISSVSTAGNKNDFRFIFEPELPKILAFFDSQVTTLLLEGTFLEGELSRTASRFISMDEAENNSNKSIKMYQTLKAAAKRNMDNNVILENFATMIALRKEIQ